MWAFDASGSTSYWQGSWNNESAIMTWKYVDFGVGITGKIVDQFTNKGMWQTTLVMKDKKGNLLLDVHTKRQTKGRLTNSMHSDSKKSPLIRRFAFCCW